MSKKRIYKVTTPTGVRLVESPTKGQAVKHCVDADYEAAVIGAAEAFELRDKGVTVEKVATKEAPAKKTSKVAAPQPSSQSASSAMESTVNEVKPVSEGQDASAPVGTPSPTTPSGSSTPADSAQGGSFIPPQPQQAPPQSSGSVNPVLAEQQRINPDAAAAAGAPAQKGPVDWEAREKQGQ